MIQAVQGKVALFSGLPHLQYVCMYVNTGEECFGCVTVIAGLCHVIVM